MNAIFEKMKERLQNTNKTKQTQWQERVKEKDKKSRKEWLERISRITKQKQ